MIDTTGSKRGTRKKSRASAKGASVGRVHRKVLFNGIHSVVPFRWFRLSEQIDRRGRNGMNSVLRRPGYGSWGRARTSSWLRTNWRAPTKSLWPIPIGFVLALFYHRQLPPALLTAGRYPLAPRPTLHALRPTLHAPRSTGSAVDAARRAGYSTPHPEWVNMLRHATFSGFLQKFGEPGFR